MERVCKLDHRMAVQAYRLGFILALLVAGSFGFFPQVARRASPVSKTSPLAKEALDIFNSKYPFGRDPPKPNPLGNFGMPNRDLDGSVVKKEYSQSKRLTDITPEQATKSFSTLARLYGEEEALQMVKYLPICLAFDSGIFEASLREWSAVFGADEAKAMVLRNPGLLAVRPDEAAKATDQTMTFSYVVSATRPIGPIGVPLLLFLLCIPLIESLTGVPIRSAIFS